MSSLEERPIKKLRPVSDRDVLENEARRKKTGYAPNPLCEVCRGSGFVHPLDVAAGPIYSDIIPCKAPGCLVEAKEQYKLTGEYLELKGVSERLQTFDKFLIKPGSDKAYEAFYQLAHGETDKPFLFCYGANGNGKTHLCQALTTVLNQRDIDTRFYNVSSLMRSMKASIQDNTLDQWMTMLCKVAGLVLDDFGMEYGTEWEATQLDTIINERWQAKLITVVTTNKSLGQVKEVMPRIFSRLCDVDLSMVVANTAGDFRLRRDR